MSRLVPDMIPLDKGVNLQTAKIIAPPGSVLDSLNYEQVDFQGQKRIDGFSRYDGSKLATFDDYYVIVVSETFTGVANGLLGVDGEVFAIVLDADNNGGVAVAVINEKLIPVAGDSVELIDRATGDAGDAFTVVSTTAGVDWEADADAHYTQLLAYHKVLRKEVEALPGGVAGLHWFIDRLYAVADVVAVSLDGTTPQIFPNDVLSNGTEEVKVLDAFVFDNTRLVFIDSFDADGLWQVEGTAVTRDGDSVGSVANGFEPFGTDAEIASFFESRSEQQVLEEDTTSLDFGWRFKDLGWKVNYENGISLYGSLPSLNQNIQGLGTQGPTSTTGNNGRPSALKQNVSISGKPAQVAGWKSTQTPTTYDLDVDNITSVDDVFIYADAFISWSGTSSTISSPGLTTSSLEARAATNTVPVILDP